MLNKILRVLKYTPLLLVFGLFSGTIFDATAQSYRSGRADIASLRFITSQLKFYGVDSVKALVDTLVGITGDDDVGDTTAAISAFGADGISLMIDLKDHNGNHYVSTNGAGSSGDSLYVSMEFSYRNDDVFNNTFTQSVLVDTLLLTDSTRQYIVQVWPPGTATVVDSLSALVSLTGAQGTVNKIVPSVGSILQTNGIDPTSVPYFRFVFLPGNMDDDDTTFVQGQVHVTYK
jgi:hypothetical protein